MRTCTIEGCDNACKQNGLCNKHDCAKRAKLNPHRQRYRHMMARCFDTNHPQYHDWGGRGITVCSEWVESYLAYCAYIDSLDKPSPLHNSIDRINNDGNYEPGNLKWSTKQEQNANKRVYANNKSGYRGVHYHAGHGKWVVSFRINGKVHNYGEYKEKSDAVNRVRSLA